MADPPPHTTPTTGQTRDPERRRPLGGMDRMRRILVHVCRDQMAPQRAQFVQSLTGHFSEGGADEVQVSCSLEKNQFVLRRGGPGGALPLKRPPFCPIKHLSVAEAAALPLDVQQRGVDVGVAILLQTANQRVLLTRRAKELRIFPNVWVPPGGHLESDETLLDAGLRELKEETGLSLEPEEVSPLILGLWESVYPPMLSRGPPQRHHVVVYMLLQSCRSHLELQASLSPSPAEVSACLWADARLVGAIVAAVDGEDGAVDGQDGAVDGEDGAVDGEDGAVPLDHLPSSISVSQVSAGGALTDVSLPLTVFVSRAPPRGPDVERVSTGTKFALELWLKSLETPDP